MTPQELFELALSYYNGTDNIPQDYLKAYDLFLEAAEAGHIESQSYVGRMLSQGKGVEQNYEEAVKWLLIASEEGNADAMNSLASCYRHGNGISRDYEKSLLWYNSAYQAGCVLACLNLAVMNYIGEGIEADRAEAFKWFLTAAEKNHPVGQFRVGWMYQEGEGVAQNIDEAIRWYKLAADQDNSDAQHNLGVIYYHGNGVKQSYQDALSWYKLAAENGDAQAQYNIAEMYYNGEGVEKDPKEAIKWYRIAAKNGNIGAMTSMGFMYSHGLGVDKDNTQAKEWYKLAAEQGDDLAQANLGIIYHYGHGVEVDYIEAIKWYRLAAEHNNDVAQFNMAIIYDCHMDDQKEAHKWYKLAAEHGNPKAQYSVGDNFYYGEGIEQDPIIALQWYRLSAEQGYAEAQAALGDIYRLGKFVSQDFDEAFKWYELAGKQGHIEAQFMCGLICNKEEKYNEAFNWCILSAEQGHAPSQYYVAEAFRKGLGVSQDINAAEKWYRSSAEQDYADAQYELGKLYRYGKGVGQDYGKAMYWYKKSANQNYSKAQYSIGDLYRDGLGVEQDSMEAATWYKLAVEQGLPIAMVSLAILYLNEDRERNLDEAIKLLERASELGNAYAQCFLARIYMDNADILEGEQKTEDLLEKSVTAGFDLAMEYLADSIMKRSHTEEDSLRAYELYCKSAKLNNTHAKQKLADLYVGKISHDFDRNEHEYIRRISKSDDIQSKLKLSDIYMRGIKVNPNSYKAVSIWRKISKLGYHIADYNLALAYMHGFGVDQDHEKGLTYLGNAAEYTLDAREIISVLASTPPNTPVLLHKGQTIPFKLDAQRVIIGSILEAEMEHILDTNNVGKIIEIYEKHPSVESCFWLSKFYKHEFNFKKAEEYFNKALEQQHPQALYLQALHGTEIEFKSYDLNKPYLIEDILESIFSSGYDEYSWGILYTLYAAYKGYKNLDKQEIFLSWEESLYTLASEELKQEHAELLRICLCKTKESFKDEFIDYMWDILLNDNQKTTTSPAKEFIDAIFMIIKGTGNVAFNHNVSLKVLKYIDKENTYYHYVDSIEKYIHGNIIKELHNINNVHIINNVTIPYESVDCTLLLSDISQKEQTVKSVIKSGVNQLNNIKTLIANKTSIKRAVIWVNREFCSSHKTELYFERAQLIKDRHIEAVYQFPKNMFKDVDSSTFLIVLRFNEPCNSVTFIKEEREIIVSYEEIERHSYVLNYDIYQPIEPESETYKVMPLSELVDIRSSFDSIDESREECRYLTDKDYHRTLLTSISKANSYSFLRGPEDELLSSLCSYYGPHLFFKYKDELYVNIQNEYATTYPGDEAYAIRLHESSMISMDYLAYIFQTDEMKRYLDEIVDRSGTFRPRDLLHKKVSVPIDKAIQNQIVEDALIKERQMSGSGVEYNVILLSEKSEDLANLLNEKGINIFQRLLSVNDGECTFEELYEQYIEDPSKALVDAIIIDSDIEDYEDVLFYFRTIRERNIQIYLLGDKNEIRIAGSKLREYFLKENRVFDQASDGYLDKLLNKMRDDLDSSNAPQAKIRNKYKAVFEAADALDKKYPDIGISKTVLRYIQTGCNIYDVDNVSGPCGSFRNVCHKLLQVFIGKRLVPDIKPGAIPSLLETGSYYDKKETKKTYVIYKRFMNNYLCKALEYFCKVTNEGVHGSQDSSRLGTAALNILMEFIVWFYENDILNNNLDLLPGQSNWKDITDQIPSHKEKVYTVKSKQVGDKKYFYANNIHISEDKPIKQGMKIKINSYNIEKMGDNEREKIDDEYMVFYASKYDIL